MSLRSRRMLPSMSRSSIDSEDSLVWGEDDSNVVVTVIPTQNRVTLQILSMWQPFKDLKLTFVVSHPVEQIRFRAQQRSVVTFEDSVLHTEMENLESEEEDAPRRVLWYKPMSWLGQIRPHRRDEAWSAGLWQTFFASCVGANIPALTELPISTCGCRKFQIDTLWNHLCTCTVVHPTRVSRRLTTGRLVRFLTSFAQLTK